ncbi:MAG: hypothetical protein AB7I36_05840 [Rhodospirillaceae bacterium]
MSTRRNTYCAVLLSFALGSCSTYREVRDWWADDAGPTEQEWAEFRALYAHENDPPPRARAEIAPSAPSAPAIPEVRRAAPVPQAPSRVARPRIAKVTPPPAPPRARPAEADAPAGSDAPVQAAPPAPVEVAILSPSLKSVAGMSEARLRQTLGEPSSATQKGAQKIWRYVGNSCSVEIVFFLDVTRNTYAALDQRTLARDGSVSARPCLRDAPPTDQSG